MTHITITAGHMTHITVSITGKLTKADAAPIAAEFGGRPFSLVEAPFVTEVEKKAFKG